MAPAAFLPVTPGDRVLDLCAAPGGKTTELASKLQGEGLLVANDISASRIKALQKNIELFGVKNAVVLCEEPSHLVPHFPAFFDAILIDAPCSGEGMFRKKGGMSKFWLEHGPDYYCEIQKELILQGADMLAPGGYLLYSTCTFAPEEDEEVIWHLLTQREGFQIVSLPDFPGKCDGRPQWSSQIPEDAWNDLKKAVRFFPHKLKGEGHFVCLLQKEGVSEKRAVSPARKGRVPEDVMAFFKDVSWQMDPGRIRVIRDHVYFLPEGEPDLTGLRVQREGLFLGILKKDRFEPVEAFAMALRMEEYARSISFACEDERVKKYLKGETIDLKEEEFIEKGWVLVGVDGYPLGWAKSDGRRLKNKYHPGWRLL